MVTKNRWAHEKSWTRFETTKYTAKLNKTVLKLPSSENR